MKTFTKIMLILAGVFGTIGVICMVVAFAMGLTTTTLWDMVENGQFSFDLSDIEIPGGNEEWGESGSVIKISNSYENMDIKFAVGILEIYCDDVEEVQVTQSNIPNLKAEVKNGILCISDESKIGITVESNVERKLVIVLPKSTELKEVNIEIGASKAEIEDIKADEFDIKVGAGQADIYELQVKEIEIEVGAGQVTATLQGSEKEYNYHVECGIGMVEIGENAYSGLGSEHKEHCSGATKELEVKCGVGEVLINFME